MTRFTFDQFVHYGRHHGGNIVNGMPWSFKFYGHPVTHMTDDRYLISGPSGSTYNFRSTDTLIIGAAGCITITSPTDDILHHQVGAQ